jgi:hypothetical protein
MQLKQQKDTLEARMETSFQGRQAITQDNSRPHYVPS